MLSLSKFLARVVRTKMVWYATRYPVLLVDPYDVGLDYVRTNWYKTFEKVRRRSTLFRQHVGALSSAHEIKLNTHAGPRGEE